MEQKSSSKAFQHLFHSCRAVVVGLKVWLGGGGNWKGRNSGKGRLEGGMVRGDTDEDDGMSCVGGKV